MTLCQEETFYMYNGARMRRVTCGLGRGMVHGAYYRLDSCTMVCTMLLAWCTMGKCLY